MRFREQRAKPEVECEQVLLGLRWEEPRRCGEEEEDVEELGKLQVMERTEIPSGGEQTEGGRRGGGRGDRVATANWGLN